MARPELNQFDAYDPSLKRALEAARKFVADIHVSPWRDGYCLSLLGPSGNGKTMLARCVMAELGLNGWGWCDRVAKSVRDGNRLCGFTARLFDMRRVGSRLMDGEWGIVDAMQEQDLAVLDDVGSDHDPRKFVASKVDSVLRARAGRWTILTANLSLRQVGEQVDSRVSSWLIRDDNVMVEIAAGDYAKAGRRK